MSSYSLRGSWVSTGVSAPSAHSLVASISRGQHSSKVLESWTRNSPLRSGKNLRGQPVPPLTPVQDTSKATDCGCPTQLGQAGSW